MRSRTLYSIATSLPGSLPLTSWDVKRRLPGNEVRYIVPGEWYNRSLGEWVGGWVGGANGQGPMYSNLKDLGGGGGALKQRFLKELKATCKNSSESQLQQQNAI